MIKLLLSANSFNGSAKSVIVVSSCPRAVIFKLHLKSIFAVQTTAGWLKTLSSTIIALIASFGFLAMDNLHVRLTFSLAKTNKIFYHS